MDKFLKFPILRTITVLMILSLPFLGSDCEDVINQLNTTTGEITGTWKLIYNEGSLHDICPGETVHFPSTTGGTATLQCPNQQPITRNYTVSGTILTYTASNVQYEIRFTQDNELVLDGQNVQRVLYYQQIASDNKPEVYLDSKQSNYGNSSDNYKQSEK
jgi:hypothetical protein